MTSGSFSPSLSCGIGLGYVDVKYTGTGEAITVKHGPAEIAARLSETPFYKQGSARK